MDFYKSILDIDNINSHSQMIIATHSPFILHNHNRSNDKIIVLKQGSNGDVSVANEPEFFGWTREEAIHEAFSISNDPEVSKPLILVEGETDEKYIKASIEFLGFDLQKAEVKWVGRINENGNAEFTGDKALNHTLSFVKSNPTVINRPLVLLYDSDTNKTESDNDNLAVRRMPFCADNNIKKGIENLLNLPANFELSKFIDEYEKTDDYGVSNTIRSLNKKKLCDHLIEGTRTENYSGVFEKFNNLLQSLKKTIDDLNN